MWRFQVRAPGNASEAGKVRRTQEKNAPRESVHPVFRQYRCVGTEPDTPNGILKIKMPRGAPEENVSGPGFLGSQDLGARCQETLAHVGDTGRPLQNGTLSMRVNLKGRARLSEGTCLLPGLVLVCCGC